MLLAERLPGLPADADEIRIRALTRLYERREYVEALIRDLERYEAAAPRRAPCVPITAGRKCS